MFKWSQITTLWKKFRNQLNFKHIPLDMCRKSWEKFVSYASLLAQYSVVQRNSPIPNFSTTQQLALEHLQLPTQDMTPKRPNSEMHNIHREFTAHKTWLKANFNVPTSIPKATPTKFNTNKSRKNALLPVFPRKYSKYVHFQNALIIWSSEFMIYLGTENLNSHFKTFYVFFLFSLQEWNQTSI